MTPEQIYKVLEDAGVEFWVSEIFEGLRVISVIVNEGESE